MARRPYPRMSGANPPIRTPKPAADTRVHLAVIRCHGDSMRDGFEVWTGCGMESTENNSTTTRVRAAVTCERCAR